MWASGVVFAAAFGSLAVGILIYRWFAFFIALWFARFCLRMALAQLRAAILRWAPSHCPTQTVLLYRGTVVPGGRRASTPPFPLETITMKPSFGFDHRRRRDSVGQTCR